MMLHTLALINCNLVFFAWFTSQYFREFPDIFVYTHEMAMMYFRDINDVQISSIEANIWRIEAAVISSDHHPTLICTGVSLSIASHYSKFWKNFTKGWLPCPLSVRPSMKGAHKACLRMVGGLCLIC